MLGSLPDSLNLAGQNAWATVCPGLVLGRIPMKPPAPEIAAACVAVICFVTASARAAAMIASWSACGLLLSTPAALAQANSPEALESVELVKGFGLVSKLKGLTNHVYGLAFSADGKRVAAGDTNGFAEVWSFPEGKRLASFSAALEKEEDVSLFHAMSFNREGTLLIAGDDLGRVHIWDIASRETLKVIRAHGRKDDPKYKLSVDDLALSPDGRTLATCGSDGQVRLWSVPSGEPIETILRHRRAVEGLAFAPDGQSLVVVDIDGRVQEIQIEGGKLLARCRPGKDDSMVGGVTIDGTGEIVVTQGYRSPTRVLSRPGLKEVRTFGPPKGKNDREGYRGNDLALHPAGRVLAVAYRHSDADHGLVVLWDVTTGMELKRFEVFFAVADNVQFSPDGRHLIAAGADRWVAVFGRSE